MGAYLDLDDVASTSPLAMQELAALRARAARARDWIDAAERLPDDDITVLIELSDGEVWTGFRDGDCWRYVSGDRIGEFNEADGTNDHVTRWMDFPGPAGAA